MYNKYHLFYSLIIPLYQMSLHILNVSPISQLSAFIRQYPDENLYDQLQILADSFPSHRAIRGDGNCFYRAFAYLYLTNCVYSSYEQAFPAVKWQYLKTYTKINSDNQFQQKLKNIYEKHLYYLNKIRDNNKKQQLVQNLFNQVEQFDELMIGYFRSKNYQHMKQNKANFLPFIRDDVHFEDQLSRITKFGSQSEGVEIYSMADAMKVKITIFCIDYNGFQPVSYMENLKDQGFYLFYRPGHYDIVYPLTDIHKQYQNVALEQKGFLRSLKQTLVLPFSPGKQKPSNKKQDKYNEKKVEQKNQINVQRGFNIFRNTNNTKAYEQKQKYEEIKMVQRVPKESVKNKDKKVELNSYLNEKVLNKQSKFDNKYKTSSSQQKSKKRVANIEARPHNLLNQILAVSLLTAVGYYFYHYVM